MAWYYQVNPHDTHDWDSTETPILVDGMFNGKLRKMALHADRNGYFYAVDRLNGEHLVTGKFSDAANWAKNVNAKGQPVRDPARRIPLFPARSFHPQQLGRDELAPTSRTVAPDSGLFYVTTAETYAEYYLTETDPRGAMGLGGKRRRRYRIAWRLRHCHRLQDRQDCLGSIAIRVQEAAWATAC